MAKDTTMVLDRAGMREYVRSAELAEMIRKWIKANGSHYHELADLAGVSPRSINKILRGEREFVTLALADRPLMAMDLHLVYVDTVWRKPGKECK